jgi:hypothetical protein
VPFHEVLRSEEAEITVVGGRIKTMTKERTVW